MLAEVDCREAQQQDMFSDMCRMGKRARSREGGSMRMRGRV
jgi:hypothetical protein